MTPRISLELSVFLLLCMTVRHCLPYFITVDAHAEDCFFDKVQNGTKLGLTFEVIEGGFLDIDVRVLGPENEEIIKRERESNGKVTFAAAKTGTYTYCFSNKMSTMTPKGVMFSMEIGEPQAAVAEQGESHSTKLTEMIRELSSALVGVKHEQEYMEVRDKIHRKINESTNSRVVMWSFFEAVVLVAMTVGQVYYLKRFFEVRRVV